MGMWVCGGLRFFFLGGQETAQGRASGIGRMGTEVIARSLFVYRVPQLSRARVGGRE